MREIAEVCHKHIEDERGVCEGCPFRQKYGGRLVETCLFETDIIPCDLQMDAKIDIGG